MGIAGALLAFFLVFHIRHDLRYALSSGEPADLGAARVAFGRGAKAVGDYENRYVRVAGTPDRESALEIDTKGSWVFTQFFRILGTDERLFVHRPASPLPAALAEADRLRGAADALRRAVVRRLGRAGTSRPTSPRRTSSPRPRSPARWRHARPAAR